MITRRGARASQVSPCMPDAQKAPSCARGDGASVKMVKELQLEFWCVFRLLCACLLRVPLATASAPDCLSMLFRWMWGALWSRIAVQSFQKPTRCGTGRQNRSINHQECKCRPRGGAGAETGAMPGHFPQKLRSRPSTAAWCHALRGANHLFSNSNSSCSHPFNGGGLALGFSPGSPRVTPGSKPTRCHRVLCWTCLRTAALVHKPSNSQTGTLHVPVGLMGAPQLPGRHVCGLAQRKHMLTPCPSMAAAEQPTRRITTACIEPFLTTAVLMLVITE